MFERMANGWELSKESFRVLRMDKELLVFPFLSGIACLLVLASFALPLWNSPYADVLTEDGQIPQDPVAYVILFAFYFVNYFVIVFFNSALVACAMIRFKGGNPTLADGFRASMSRLPHIVGWALLSATVGVILRLIESYSDKAGQIAAALLGAGWSIATYFVIPVLVVEQVGPFEAVKRSFAVLRKTWGESLTANFGIGLIVFLFSLLGIIPVVGGFFLLAGGHVAIGIALVVIGLIYLGIVSLASTALNSILLAALYLYAAEGEVPRQFDQALMAHAFAKRR